MKRFRIIAVIALALAGAGAGYVFWQKHKAAQQTAAASPTPAPSAPSISVVRADSSDFVETVMVSGSLVAREEISVAPEVEGLKVLELRADVGDEVKKGDVLATLVTVGLEAQIAQNDASRARADASIAQAKATITQAEARVKEAKLAFDRAVPLNKDQYLSDSVLDQRRATLQAAEAQLNVARDGLKVADAEKAQIEAQRAEIDWRRSNAEIKAPADGIISRRGARVGAIAIGAMMGSGGDPLFRIIANGEMELDAEIVETEIGKLKPGQKAHVTVPGAADVEGTVRLISPEIDKTTRLGHARIALGKNPNLRIGAFARGTVETNTSHGISLPPAAVMFDASGAYVQVVMSDKVQRRDVTTGLVSGGRIEIKTGLNAGDVVVARSGTFLRDGDIVRPVFLDTATNQTAEAN